jgi:hypothetical protein
VINPGHIKSWTRTNSRSVLDTFLFGDRPQFEHEFDDRQNSEDLWRNLWREFVDRHESVRAYFRTRWTAQFGPPSPLLEI